MDDPACVFAPRCADGEPCHCITTFAGVPHTVYIAFYGILPKVGMTQERRLPERLREQGADAWFTVGRADLGRGEARALEQELSLLHRIPEYRTGRELLAQLARPVPWDALHERAQALQARLGAHHEVGELHHVDGHTLPQPLPGAPHRVQAPGVHAGTWLGCKGRHLVYADAAPGRLAVGGQPLAAVAVRDLVGRVVAVQAA